MQKVLEIHELSKSYGGTKALKNLSLRVHKGDIYGLLGPNGSGKTTTLGIVLGVTMPTSGKYTWFEKGNGHELRKKIGALLDKPNFYANLSARQNLKLVAAIKDISNPRIDEALERTGMTSYAKRAFGTYSTGMKQRLSLASALLGTPQVLILDEPTNGLDPQGIADVRELILQIAGEGVTIILASHLLDEVQKVCSHVAVLNQGNKIFEGQVHALLGGEVDIEIQSDQPEKLERALHSFDGIAQVSKDQDHFLVRLKEGYKTAELSSYLINHDVDISHFAKRQNTLEQEFLNLLSGNRA